MKVGNKRGRISNKEGEKKLNREYMTRKGRMEREKYRNLIVSGKTNRSMNIVLCNFPNSSFQTHNLKCSDNLLHSTDAKIRFLLSFEAIISRLI